MGIFRAAWVADKSVDDECEVTCANGVWLHIVGSLWYTAWAFFGRYLLLEPFSEVTISYTGRTFQLYKEYR